jgi:hypothetical protein
LIWALVVIAVRSLKAAKVKRTSSRPMFQLPPGAATTAATKTAANATAWMAIILGVGRSLVIADWWSFWATYRFSNSAAGTRSLRVPGIARPNGLEKRR